MDLSFKDKTVRVGIKIFGVIGFFVALHLAARQVVFVPLAKAKKDLDEVQNKLEETQKLVNDNPDARTRTKEIMARMDALKEKSVSSKELPKIIQLLTKKSSELNLEIISIRPVEDIALKDASLPQGVSKDYIEIVAKAPYAALGDYLKALKEMSVIFTVETISIEKFAEAAEEDLARAKKKEATAQGKVVATMLISSYTVWHL